MIQISLILTNNFSSNSRDTLARDLRKLLCRPTGADTAPVSLFEKPQITISSRSSMYNHKHHKFIHDVSDDYRVCGYGL